MKTFLMAAGLAVAGAAASADDYNFSVTNMMDEGSMIAPLVVLNATLAEPVMFSGNDMSDAFKTVATEGDPRPMNGDMPDAVAGVVLGDAGPPEVLIDGGKTFAMDMFIFGTTLRFFAKDESCADCIISGVYDIAMGGGEVMLHSFSTGQADGSGEITVAKENAVKVVITAN